MNAMLYDQKLAEFKNNEKPEVVLLVADNDIRIKIIIAWSNTEVKTRRNIKEFTDTSENSAWNWLWENTEYSLEELAEKSTVGENHLQERLKPLIGNRIIYPDGTINSYVKKYLREKVINLFEEKTKKTKKTR